MEMFREAGVFGWLALFAAAVGVGLAAAQVVLASKLDLVPLLVGSVVATVLVGALAFTHNLRLATGGYAGADAASRAMIVAMGTSRALHGATIAFVAAFLQLGVVTPAIAWRRRVERRPPTSNPAGAR